MYSTLNRFPKEEDIPKSVWFVENIITKRWIKISFNSNCICKIDDWIDTSDPIAALSFYSKEKCYNWICEKDLKLCYQPSEHIFI